MKISVLVDSIDYVKNEIYQQHIYNVLSNNDNFEYIEWQGNRTIKGQENVFICMRFRNVVSNANEIKAWLGNRIPIIQDYDPWVFYEDGSKYKNGYEKVANVLENVKFAIPNLTWSKFISKKISKKFFAFKLGVPAYCCDNTPWEKRSHRLEFKGRSYSIREKSFQIISEYIPINWNKEIISPYSNFLSYLSNVRVWAQNESIPIIVDNQTMCNNWLWPKAIEILSRGCFLIRDMQEEAKHYGIDKLPTVFLYTNVKETPEILDKIESMSDKEKNERINETISWIKKQNYYVDIPNNLEIWFNDK